MKTTQEKTQAPSQLTTAGTASAQPPQFALASTSTGKTKGSGAKDIKVTIAADTESEFLSKEYREGAVGHAWIKVQEPGQAEDSYGFWPANLGAGGGFDPSQPWKSVAGEVRHPDTSHKPKQEMSEMTDAAGLAEGIKYAGDNASTNYNLLTYNCTTFARQFFKKSTGVSAPSAGFIGLAENPNWLANGIERRNKKKANP